MWCAASNQTQPPPPPFPLPLAFPGTSPAGPSCAQCCHSSSWIWTRARRTSTLSLRVWSASTSPSWSSLRTTSTWRVDAATTGAIGRCARMRWLGLVVERRMPPRTPTRRANPPTHPPARPCTHRQPTHRPPSPPPPQVQGSTRGGGGGGGGRLQCQRRQFKPEQEQQREQEGKQEEEGRRHVQAREHAEQHWHERVQHQPPNEVGSGGRGWGRSTLAPSATHLLTLHTSKRKCDDGGSSSRPPRLPSPPPPSSPPPLLLSLQHHSGASGFGNSSNSFAMSAAGMRSGRELQSGRVGDKSSRLGTETHEDVAGCVERGEGSVRDHPSVIARSRPPHAHAASVLRARACRRTSRTPSPT